eukprot:m.260780 g.260780  ORF g.260780 m.260780 type:complete len:443 (-) comp26651_c0_seq6:348-1676(-)
MHSDSLNHAPCCALTIAVCCVIICVHVEYSMTTITVKGIKLCNMPPMDTGGTANDPYVIISVNGVEAKTATLWNNDTPEFPETLTLELGEDCEYPITVDVKIWDEDKKSADDLAATTQFTIEADGKGTHADDAMKPQGGTATMNWQSTRSEAAKKKAAEKAAQKAAAAKKAEADVAARKKEEAAQTAAAAKKAKADAAARKKKDAAAKPTGTHAVPASKPPAEKNSNSSDNPNFALLGAVLGAILLIFAIADNATTSNLIIEFKSTGSPTSVFETGIWLNRQVSGDGKSNDPSPTYCDYTQKAGKCWTSNKNDACCVALEHKCYTLQVFAVFAVISAVMVLVGFVNPVVGMVGAAFHALCCLIMFSVTSSYINGEFYSKKNNEINTDANCGFNAFQQGVGDENTTTGGATLAMTIISFFIALICVVCFAKASKSNGRVVTMA